MAHSSEFIEYTCGKVFRKVNSSDYSAIAAEVDDLDIESSLQAAAKLGATIAQELGASAVRAEFDRYIEIVEAYLTPEQAKQVKRLMNKKPTKAKKVRSQQAIEGDLTIPSEEVAAIIGYRAGKTVVIQHFMGLLRDKSFIVDTETTGKTAENE